MTGIQTRDTLGKGVLTEVRWDSNPGLISGNEVIGSTGIQTRLLEIKATRVDRVFFKLQI